MNGAELIAAIDIFEKEKGIPREDIIAYIEDAIAKACPKAFGVPYRFVCNINDKTGEVENVFSHREVVEEVEDHRKQISLEEAKEINEKYEVGNFVDVIYDDMDKLGRVSAGVARQALMQSIRNKEKEQLAEEFAELVGQVVPGEVLRAENDNLIIQVGKKEVLLPQKEQIKGEKYVRGDRIRVVVVSVGEEKKTGGMGIYVSRTHPDMVRALLTREVPEIKAGIVKIEALSREAGVKTKVAVSSNDPNVDPRGACIGANGSRIIPISNELSGEKMDIIKYSSDPIDFICSALAPAEVERIEIVDEDSNEVKAFVHRDMLSLAIGGGGQNVRLAARLTGYKIDLIEIDDNGKVIVKNG